MDIKQTIKKYRLVGVVLFVTLLCCACDRNDGPVERAGEAVDEQVEKTRESIDDAGDALEDEMDKAQ